MYNKNQFFDIMKNLEKQAIKYVAQVMHLMDVCNIAEEDRKTPTYQVHDGRIYIDFSVYELDVEVNKDLWGLVALMANGIETTTYKSTNKYRGLIRYELMIKP